MRNKRIHRVLSVCLAVFICAASLASCALFNPARSETREFFNYFDTICRLRIDTEDRNGIDDAALKFEELISDFDKLFDIYEPAHNVTNLYDVNANAGNGPLTVDARLFDALEFGKEMHSLTDGYCNIAFGAVLSLWHDARKNANDDPKNASLPSAEAIEEAMKHTDISSLVLDRDTLSVSITDPETSIDLGAIAKGYVADLAAELLLSLGYENFLIDLGGNIVACGKNYKNTDWRAMIENPYPDKSKGYTEIVYLRDNTLVTSGSYQRFFTVDKKNYSHIISKDNGMPPEYYLSVSVLAPAGSSGLADTLSTALFCMPLEKAKALASSIDGVEALWMLSDGSLEMTDGFGGAK